MLIIREGAETGYVIPNPWIFGVENMSSMCVDLNLGFGLKEGMAISADVRTLFNNKNFLVQDFGDALSDDGSEKTASDDNVFSVKKLLFW